MKNSTEKLMNNKRIILFYTATFFLLIAIVLSFMSCGKVPVNQSKATLVFNYADKRINTELSNEESEQLRNIVKDKSTFSDDMISCGFSDKTAFIIGGRTFCPACDGCNTIKEWESGKLINISKTDRNTIERIFKNHGGFFPCV